MNIRLLALVPAIVIAAAGIVLLCRQRADIVAAQEAAPRSGLATTGPASAAMPAHLTSPSPPARPPALTSGEARAAAFLAGLNEKARPLIEKAGREASANSARRTAGRVRLLLGLNAEEQDALRRHLETEDGPDDTAAHAWVAQHCSMERVAAFDAAEAARRTAGAEHDAQEAIYRLSRIVDLTPEQKDRLFSGFVGEAATRVAAAAEPLELRTAFSVKDTPDISDAAALARPLLTKEQLAFFDAAVEQEKNAVHEASQGVMGQLLPGLLSALQEAAAEKK